MTRRKSTYKGDPAAEGEAAARHDNWVAAQQGRCVTDEELADELDNLTQDEAAELAETIEAERKLAIKEMLSDGST